MLTTAQPTKLTSKGQVTVPKRIRDALQLLPGTAVVFAVNAAGEVVLQRPAPAAGERGVAKDRFEAVRGSADVPWRTGTLMAAAKRGLTPAMVLVDSNVLVGVL